MIYPIDKLAEVIFSYVSTCGLMTNKTAQYMKQLYPCEAQITSVIRNYWIKKIRIIVLILFFGVGVTAYLWIISKNNHALVDDTFILRNEPGMGERQVCLIATNEHGKSINVTVDVEERKYTQKELNYMYENLLREINAIVLNHNESWDKVVGDLYLVKNVQGYPFNLSWESGDYRYLSNQGKIMIPEIENRETDIQLELYLQVEHGEFSKEHIFRLCLHPELMVHDFQEKVRRGIDKAKKIKTKQEIELPKSLDGEEITWKEKRDDSWVVTFLLTILLATGIWMAEDRQVYVNIQKRNQQLIEEYPIIISKITLYMGAGMNLYSIWKKLATEGNDNPIYEEMLYTSHEIESGASQVEAFEKFVLRVRQQQYTRLIALLVQNLQKGNGELLILLRHEAVVAIEDSKAQLKKRGEEMNTKLLLPMVMMLGMVMLLVIFPVFMSM